MNRGYLHSLLRDWAYSIFQELDENSYNSKTTIYKIMECGRYGASIRGGVPVLSYWPDARIKKIGMAVNSLPKKYKDVIIIIFVYGQSQYMAAKILHCDKNAVNRRLIKAENIIISHISVTT